MTDDARERILAAAGRCIVRRGDTQIRMAEVADDAGLVRSTVYRYFPTRDDLLLGLVLMRIDAALARLVRSLRWPDDPRRCIPRMVLVPVDSVDGDPLNEALFASESTALAGALELGSERIVDVVIAHYEPLFATSGRQTARCIPIWTGGRWRAGSTPRHCSCCPRRGDTDRTGQSGASSTSSSSVRLSHRSDIRAFLSDRRAMRVIS